MAQQTTDPRKPNEKYHDGYWHTDYTVLSIKERNGARWFTVRTDQGVIRSHCTAWDPERDRKVGQPCRRAVCRWNR